MCKKKSQQTGISLIEVLVTLVILSVGLLGLASLQSLSVKSSLDIAQRSQASWLVNELAERMRANPRGLTSYRSLPIASCSTPAANCSDQAPGANASPCNATQMATFDIWEVVCGQAAATNIMANSSDSLDLTHVAIRCEDGSCDSNTADVFSVELFWTSKLVNSSALLSTAASTAHQTRSIKMRVKPTYGQ